jgi:hypothetical protein
MPSCQPVIPSSIPSENPSEQPSSIPSSQYAEYPTKSPSQHSLSVVAVYNITFDIIGIPFDDFDSTAISALLSFFFDDYCETGARCVSVLSYSSLNDQQRSQLFQDYRSLQAAIEGDTTFILEMRSVLKLDTISDVEYAINSQWLSINESFYYVNACQNLVYLAVEWGTVTIENGTSCHFADIKFSEVFRVYEVRTAAPTESIIEVQNNTKSLLVLVYVLLPLLLLCCISSISIFYVVRMRKVAVVHARHQPYLANRSSNGERSLKVKPGAFGYDIENFGVLGEQ